MHIKKEELEKIDQNNKESEEQSEITIEIKKGHTCEQKDIEKSNSQDALSKVSMDKKVREIILQNPLVPFFNHKENLKKEKLFLNDSTLKNKIHNIKSEIFPPDDDFFRQISTCNLNLSNNERQMFFRCRQTFFNPESQKIEENVLFFSDFQLKLICEAKEWYMDGTFKTCPRKYYQCLSLLIYNPETDLYIPVCHCLMTNKTELSYINFLEVCNKISRDLEERT